MSSFKAGAFAEQYNDFNVSVLIVGGSVVRSKPHDAAQLMASDVERCIESAPAADELARVVAALTSLVGPDGNGLRLLARAVELLDS